jgi:acyl-CoA dehydrogenase
MSKSVPVPFADPPWINGEPSPYYNESHRKWQKNCRAWLHDNLVSHALEWENAGHVPEHVFQTFSKANMLIPNLPAPLPIKLLKSLGIHDMLGLKVEDFDYTHFSIYVNEMKLSGLGGPSTSLTAGMAYGVPPIIKYASKAVQDRFLPDLFKGTKRICIAITEPSAGSDVANIAASAKKTADGKHYIVNGQKKW